MSTVKLDLRGATRQQVRDRLLAAFTLLWVNAQVKAVAAMVADGVPAADAQAAVDAYDQAVLASTARSFLEQVDAEIDSQAGAEATEESES